MNRILTVLNFLGVLAVAGLCYVQWTANSDLTHQIDRLSTEQDAQTATIADQQKTLKQNDDDLADLRNRVAVGETALSDARGKLAGVSAERDRLADDNGKLKAALAQWQSAVAARDDQLKQAATQINQAISDRNDAVKRFNDLATKYNAMVKTGSAASGQ